MLRAQILPHSIALSNYVLALALSADEKVLAVGGIALTTFRVDTGSVMRSFNWKGRCKVCDVLLCHTPSDILQMDYVCSVESHCSYAV